MGKKRGEAQGWGESRREQQKAKSLKENGENVFMGKKTPTYEKVKEGKQDWERQKVKGL